MENKRKYDEFYYSANSSIVLFNKDSTIDNLKHFISPLPFSL